jgi:hypothetical protein
MKAKETKNSRQFGKKVENFIIADFEGGKWVVGIRHE